MKTLGIDIGTTSISGTIIDVLSGEQLDTKTIPNRTKIAGQPWRSEQDADQIYRICQTIITEYTQRWEDIIGIGIAGQMHGIVYLDEEGNLLSPLYTWEDGRGNLEPDFNRFYSSLKKLLSELSSELHVISVDAILREMGFPQNWEDIKGL